MILLDTHAILWTANEELPLGHDSKLMVQAAREAGQLAISSISFWEIALLAEKRRLELTNRRMGFVPSYSTLASSKFH